MYRFRRVRQQRSAGAAVGHSAYRFGCEAFGEERPLLAVDAARSRAVALAKAVAEFETIPCAEALGRIAAQDVVAPMDLPPFDASAMDGFAVRAPAAGGAQRWRVVDTSAAGRPARRSVGAGEAIRIFTGAVLPKGADAVVLQEDVALVGDVAESTEPVRCGQHVRRRGQDASRGEVLLAAGTRLTAYRLAWLAACGIRDVKATRRIRVALFATGDELVAAGQPLGPGQIYESNRFALATLLAQKPILVRDFGCVADSLDATRSVLGEAARRADLIVASGGVSVGDADFVKRAVAELGSIDFWRVALKPGKPLAVGRVGDALFFGLPGNPVSTIVTYLLFVAPVLDALGGAAPAAPLELPATLDAPVRHSKGRREYLRGAVRATGGGLSVSVEKDQGSHRLATLARANCLVVAGEEHGDLVAGDTVKVLPFSGAADHLLAAATAVPG